MASDLKWGGNKDGFGYCERCGDWTAVVEIDKHDYCVTCEPIVKEEIAEQRTSQKDADKD